MPFQSANVPQARFSKTLLCSSLLLTVLAACSENESNPTPQQQEVVPVKVDSGISLSTISTRPWLVTGGDVLAEVSVKEGVDASQLAITMAGEDITAQFQPVDNNRLQALLTDLPLGDSTLAASLGEGAGSEALAITNFPITGPIISGVHQDPFVCQSQEFMLATGAVLGEALDDDCTVDTRIDYVYWSSSEETFKPFRRGLTGGVPADTAQITNESGETIYFIVRVETGTVNRAIYEIAMLHDPFDGEVDPWTPSPGWNKKLVYTHGGGCRSGWFQQGTVTGGVLHKELLEMGYALTSSTLNVFGQNCNDLLASETHIMVKERFIEHYGVPSYTVATGVSGGSYQSHQTADNYPDVFDGIIVGLSFPDVTSSTIFTLADARLLNYYFSEVNPDGFTQQQQQAITGFGVYESMPNLSRGAARIDPVYYYETPPEEQGGEVSIRELSTKRYHPSIPNGLRATVYDHTAAVYGQIGPNKVAQRPLDNTGVQYGLKALNDGVITFEQFVQLNEDIGGFDRDANHVPERHKADSYASKMAIESGRILNGGGGLASTPVIDYRMYTDNAEGGDIHMMVHQFATRARLVKANGHADNQVMLVGGRWGFEEESNDLRELFEHMDSWILAIQNDESALSEAEKVVAAKPGSLVDACWDNSGSTRVKIEEQLSASGNGSCGELYPVYSTPRNVAGAPLANDIVSCRLKPVEPADYSPALTADQISQLQIVFPQGVCDWNEDDASDARYQGTWTSFGPSEVNLIRPIPDTRSGIVEM